FWRKNRRAVFVAVAVVLLAIVGREAWGYLAQRRELDVENAYNAASSPEQLKAFAAAHAEHTLAGIAHLRLGGEADKAGQSAHAVAGYDKAIAILKSGPLVARAQLGRALAKAQSGKTPEAGNELKQLANDTKQLKGIRTEAAYHLTSLAVDAGNAADAQKY